ncbi:hypothetical protein [Actimicrobium antarcticum]|uniref:hypothetical protein n=1 Tax=Actimicrobium antarcticum TaxID=1051899 RepID=UPI0031DF7051
MIKFPTQATSIFEIIFKPNNKFMKPKTKMRLNAAACLIGSIGGIIYNWQSVMINGTYRPMVSFVLPLFACTSLAAFLYPTTKAEYFVKHGSEQIPWKHIPLVPKALFVSGCILGVLQCALFSGDLLD